VKYFGPASGEMSVDIDQTPTIPNEADLNWTQDVVTPVTFHYKREGENNPFDNLMVLFGKQTSSSHNSKYVLA
jgi:hypothetical protein